MTAPIIIFVVVIVGAVLLILTSLLRFAKIKPAVILADFVNQDKIQREYISQNQWSISTQGDCVILTLGEFYDMPAYGFIWDILNATPERAFERKTLLDAAQLIIDFSELKSVGTMSCELYGLGQQYALEKGKSVLFCGLNQNVQSIFDTLGCAAILSAPFEAPLIFPALENALLYAKNRDRNLSI